MSVYLSSQKVIKEWIDYNDHMNVSYYLLIFDKYGADTLNNIFKMGEHSAKTTKKSTMIVENSDYHALILSKLPSGIAKFFVLTLLLPDSFAPANDTKTSRHFPS